MRSTLTALGICAAVASFVVLVCMSSGIERAWVNSLSERGIHMLAVSGSAVELLTATIDGALEDRMRGVDGVHDVSGELVNLIRVENPHTEDDVHVLIRGWAQGSFVWRSVELSEGRLPAGDRPKGVVIGESLARVLNLGIGDPLPLDASGEFFVSGIAMPAGAMNDNAVILLLATLQTLLEKQGKVTQFALCLEAPDDPQSVADVARRLEEHLPELSFFETSQIAKDNDVLKVFRAMAWGTSVVAVVMALLVVLNTLLMSVTERTRQIGVLSALGWHPGRILSAIVMEGVIIACLGSVAGFAVGTGALRCIVATPRLRGLVEPQVTLEQAMQVVLIALVMGVCGSLYPAWRALKLNPVTALRYE